MLIALLPDKSGAPSGGSNCSIYGQCALLYGDIDSSTPALSNSLYLSTRNIQPYKATGTMQTN